MKSLSQRVSLPLLILVGTTLIGPQTAEAARWRRYATRAYVNGPDDVPPPVVQTPGVRVYAPGVGVHVGPGVDVVAPGVEVHVGPGVNVAAPGVRVNVGSRYPSYHRGSYYLRW